MQLPVDPVGLDRLLGLRLDAAGPDEVRATLTVRPELHQPFGILHGGVYCSVVETTASVGAALWFARQPFAGASAQVVGVSNHTDFLRAVRQGNLEVVAAPVHRGRSQQLWQVEVRDDRQRLVARGQVRLANLTAPAALPDAGPGTPGPVA